MNARSARITNTGALVVEVMSEEMLRSKLTVVGIPSDMPSDDVVGAFCQKDSHNKQLVESD